MAPTDSYGIPKAPVESLDSYGSPLTAVISTNSYEIPKTPVESVYRYKVLEEPNGDSYGSQTSTVKSISDLFLLCHRKRNKVHLEICVFV